MTADHRTPILRRLVAYTLPIEPVLESLADVSCDCVEDLVLVTPRDIVQVIDRFVSGELSIAQVTDWADLLESRHGIGFAPPHTQRVSEVVSRIANPNLYGEITATVLRELRAELIELAA